jgi:signal transduction histidine kinase
MIKWIRENRWLPTLFLGMATFLLFGGTDLTVFGYTALIPAAIYSLSIFFARSLPVLALGCLAIAEASQVMLGLPPITTSAAVAITLFVIAAFGNAPTRTWSTIFAILSAAVIAYLFGYGPYARFDSLGMQVEPSQTPLAVAISIALVAGWLILASLLGRLAFVRIEHIGSPLDRALTLLSQARLNLELAKQNERVDIARDLTELLVQRIAAVLSLVEGGSYAASADPAAAKRVLERATESAHAAQLEVRRLYDLLHSSRISAGGTAGLDDLDALIVAFRELGFNSELRVEGEPFALDEGAALCIYRIVFESMENTRKHCKPGTTITVDFTWVDAGLQVLIKDNGIEVENRSRSALGEVLEGYDVQDDLDSLVIAIDGATLSVMRERAALYEGSVEAQEVPGVGFTVSAIFPSLKAAMGRR